MTADGSAVWTRVGSSRNNHDLHPGHRLTFGQQLDDQRGHIWRRFVLDASDPATASRRPAEYRFDNLKVAINGTEYTLNGSLELFTVGTSGALTNAGEIRIINNGTLVARIYGDVRNALTIEILAPLVPL